MARTIQVVLGRDPRCDVPLEHPTVSARHARLSWVKEGLLLEDLGSANGTYLHGERITHAYVQRGDDVLLGELAFPWGAPGVSAFLGRGPRGRTLVASALPVRRPPVTGPAGPSRARTGWVVQVLQGLVGSLVLLGVGALLVLVVWPRLRGPATVVAPSWTALPDAPLLPPAEPVVAVGSPEELAIRQTRLEALVAAIDATDPSTRNAAVRIAAQDDGPFHVEQVARLWTHARGRWRYVNDPRGGEYFAKASETLANEFAGDCDDFAVLLTAMVVAIGGEARIVMMDGPKGGHAYAEACIRMEPAEVSTRLARHYRRTWDRYLGRQRVTRVHYRADSECPMWLNLDWNARVPGGLYAEESWAVAVFPDGRTATLAPSKPEETAGATAAGTNAIRAAALPPAP